MKCEYALLSDDYTWETRIIETDVREYDREKLVEWAELNLLGLAEFRRVVLVQVYSIPEEEEEK